MTRLDRLLDALHGFAEGLERATRRKKKWTRERVVAAVGVGASIISAVSLAFPQVRGIAVAAGLMDALQKSEVVPQLGAPEPTPTNDDEES